jgi:hypothetical protein
VADPLAVIRRTLEDPARLLGMVERNVEAKLISPVLELLGWDPARHVLWGPQVLRLTAEGRQVVEADAFVANIAQGRLRFLVEAKRWARPLDTRAIDQALAYLADVAARRALLTNGHRWFVLDAGSRDPLVAKTIESRDDGVRNLVAALNPFLSPATAPTSRLPPSRPATTASADLEELAASDPLVAELLAGIQAISAEHPDLIELDAGPKGLHLKAVRTGRALVPVNAADPLKPDLYTRELEALDISDSAREALAATLRRLPAERTPDAVTAFLAALATIVNEMS